VLAAIYVAEWAARGLSGGSPGGPTASSYATAADGTAAWAELLARNGHEVSRARVRPSRAILTASSTAVVLGPSLVLADDVRELDRFVRAGGRLITGGTDVYWLRPIVGEKLAARSGGVRVARPLARVPEVAGVNRVVTHGEGSWSKLAGSLPVLGRRGLPIVAVANVGKGRVVLLADDSMLSNDLLGRASNARFSLDIAGLPRREVVFFETYHGYGKATSTGLSAIPPAWRAFILLGFAAVIVFMVARGRRLGPPEPERRELDPPRREYVEAMAGILARTRAPTEALQPLRDEVRRRYALAGPGSLPEDEAAAVARETVRSEDVLPLGRALARLEAAQGRRSWNG
jgi:Domain of unknown function (DUF4350)